jgi:murein DD-endopeptidase MepM/ murein hydrolase activator NlpD
VLLNDFPLGKHVQVGPIGQSDLGLWIWIDKVDIYELPGDGGGGQAWAAVWEINAENTSTDIYFEFNPGAQAYIYEVRQDDGTTRRGQFLPDFDVMRYLAENHGLDFPIIDEEESLVNSFGSNSLAPSSKETVRLAAPIPGPTVLRLAYTFLPNSASSTNTDGGGNEAIWFTEQDDGDCPSEVTPGPGGIPAQQIGGNVTFKLARWPTAGTIVRGYGCTADFTGQLGSDCPSTEPWFHSGIDISAASGTGIVDVLPDNGVITYAGPDNNGQDCSGLAGAFDPKTGLGNYILQNGLVDGTTVTLYYGHLSAFSVNSQDTTTPGKIIGQVGSTGCSTGPHLHFAVAVGGLFIDPLTVLP